MTTSMLGLTVITLTLAAAAPLRATQTAGSAETHPPATATSDTAHRHRAGAGHHRHGHKWLSFDAATRTVTFKLVAGRAHGVNRLNFNGYTHGGATLVVPSRSSVVINFVNQDSVPHSAAIIADQEPMPANVEQAALPHAATKDLTRGLSLHDTDVMRFTTPASGSYRIVSGVPGQARSGMWIRFEVDPTAEAPAWRKHT